MNAKQKIEKKLQEYYDEGVVNAGQVWKGYGYDSVREATGWWFRTFTGQMIYLGKSVSEAFDAIDSWSEVEI